MEHEAFGNLRSAAPLKCLLRESGIAPKETLLSRRDLDEKML
ncbi:MAG: hypothetical protein ACTS4V_01210 [Candidatus Hodgkinia cicadicola]